MHDPLTYLQERAPWLLQPELGTCVVGSAALAQACLRAGEPPPPFADVDLAWALDVDAGTARLEAHAVAMPTTEANRGRGTLAMKLDGQRFEITTFRGRRDGPLEARIVDDLRARDMTIGALAWWLAEDRVLDPLDGLADWRHGRIVPVGDVADRIREHPVRWLRYYRRAAQWGFALDRSVRKVRLDPALVATVPPEALAAELRSALLDCRSPGQFVQELFEQGLLAQIAPELAPLFDGRPAGPVRHHPEIGQGLHMVLALEWISERTRARPADERLAAALAVLCHDLGKGSTPSAKLPSHPGHEAAGLPLIASLFARLPSLGDAKVQRLCEKVCLLHLQVRRLREQRAGTLASLYERHFRTRDLPIELFALAVGADVGGRLGRSDEGDAVAQRVAEDLRWLRERCESVDAGELRQKFPDVERFRAALHEARARALAADLRS